MQKSRSLLFSFELCYGGERMEAWLAGLTLLLSCYFLLNYAQWAEAGWLKMQKSRSLLFSFELCYGGERMEAWLAGLTLLLSCYFLLNYAKWRIAKTEAYEVAKASCYFLLNYA